MSSPLLDPKVENIFSESKPRKNTMGMRHAARGNRKGSGHVATCPLPVAFRLFSVASCPLPVAQRSFHVQTNQNRDRVHTGHHRADGPGVSVRHHRIGAGAVPKTSEWQFDL